MLVEIALILTIPGVFIMAGSSTIGTFLGNPNLGLPIVMIALGVAGYGIWGFTSSNLSSASSVSFVAPICQLAFWTATYLLFLKLMQRPPTETTFSWAPGLFWDRFYAIGVLLVMILLPVNIAFSLENQGAVAIGT